MNKLRLFPFVVIGINLLVALIAVAAQGQAAAPLLAMNLCLLAVASIVYFVQGRSAKKAVSRSEETIRALAATAFDRPAEVVARFESSLPGSKGILAPGGALSPAEGFTANGVCRGVATKIASGTSMAARDKFELSHTYSYVTVDAGNAAGRFRFLAREGAARWAQLYGDLADQPLGDAAFDAKWVVAGDAEIAKAVLDDALRAQLTTLQVRSTGLSSVGMSIELTGEGLVVRWPGELDAALGATLRDVALTLRERLRGYLQREGLIERESGVRVDVAEREGAEVEAVAREGEARARSAE